MRHLFVFLFVIYSFAGVVLACDRDDSELIDIDGYDCLMIIPDIQNYIDNPAYHKHLLSIVNYANDNPQITNCFQVGDLTNNNRLDQWNTVREQFFSRFPEGKRPIFCLGNHDYGNNGSSDVRESNIPNDLLPERDAYMEEGGLENYVRHIVISGKEYAVIVLEFGTRNETLEWASKVIKEDSSTPYIILTHAFLNNDGQIFDYKDSNCNQTYSQKHYNMGGGYINDSKEIFDKLIYPNPNIKMVICGHCLHRDFIAIEYVPNEKGNEVPCIMVNYQHAADGGNGYIGVLAIKDEKFMLCSYSTSEKKYKRLYATFPVDN